MVSWGLGKRCWEAGTSGGGEARKQGSAIVVYCVDCSECNLILFFYHGFFTELHGDIKPPAAGNKKELLNDFFFRDLPCPSVVNFSFSSP